MALRTTVLERRTLLGGAALLGGLDGCLKLGDECLARGDVQLDGHAGARVEVHVHEIEQQRVLVLRQ